MNKVLEQAEKSQLTPGQILKAAREAKNITINDVAQRLLLSKQIIAALEVDDYSRIYAKVYAEGYLKAYAQFLQVPVDSVLTSFRGLNIYTDFAIKPESRQEVDLGFSSILKSKNIVLILFLGLSVLILGWLLFTHKSEANKSAAVNVQSGINVINKDNDKSSLNEVQDGNSSIEVSIPEKNKQDTFFTGKQNNTIVFDGAAEETINQ